MKAVLFTSLILLSISAEAATLTGQLACRPGESWNFKESGIPVEFVDGFNLFLGHQAPVVRGFSQALALRTNAESPEQKYFAEYWVSRALYGARMIHIAKEGFSVLAGRPVTAGTVGIQLAALECLSEIRDQYPSVDFSEKVVARLPDYTAQAKAIGRLEPLWEAATAAAISGLSMDRKLTRDEEEKLMSALDGSGPYENISRGFLAARRGDADTAIRELSAFADSSHPAGFSRYDSMVLMLLARSLYAKGRYDEASRTFKRIPKSSNDLAESLQELAWADLMAGHYKEAIGTAINLQRGGMRNTFAPEAPMVMAMALNELCQFPDSISASEIFKKNYEASHRWLENWIQKKQSDSLYKLAIAFLKKQNAAPVRVASEWLHSPVFISNQEEINLLIDEKGSAKGLSLWGSKEQNQLADTVLEDIQTYKGDDDKRFEQLKQDLTEFRRMQRAAPIWKTVLAAHQERAPGLQHRLADEIDADLRVKSLRMHDQIEEVVENLDLVEVEIYNGASEDIVWQNAHPGYRDIARKLDQEGQNRSPASQVWNWGHTSVASDDDSGEIWEDELGSFKADLVDNCSSKEKYLAVMTRHGAEK